MMSIRNVLLFAVFAVFPLFSVSAQESVQVVSEQATSSATTTLTTEEVVVYEPVLYFFHSPTCPHCRKEQVFLDGMEEKYPALTVYRYEAANKEYQPQMIELATEYGIERNLGQVPLTFVGPLGIAGYGSDETTGVQIEEAIRTTLGLGLESESGTAIDNSEEDGIAVPFFGTITPSEHSLAGLAVLLGLLDGFNVCSLGALVLIIGLTLKLQRRRAIVLFGGTFIVTTALVYGALIVVWYQIFDIFSGYLDLLKIGVGLLSLGGGLYFLKEYFRMVKQGAVCELSESKLIQKMTAHTGRAFEDTTKLLTMFGAVFAFAAVVAIVEFPCSAAVPVVFAGILADAGISTLSYLGHIGLFVLFYMLDELIVFGIAAYRLKIWMTNGAFTKWAVLAEALILVGIGVFYLGAMFGVL